MGICYKMNKNMYDSIRYQMHWNPRERKMCKGKKNLTKQEVINYVNETFGLKNKVKEIVII